MSSTTYGTTRSPPSSRVDWVDYAKGICIILVVMMHSTLGVEKAMGVEGGLHSFIEWARPFRMPDFFLLSGLFLARRIAVPWRSFLDKKLMHFFYFYLLWMSLQFLFKGYGIWQDQGLSGLALQYALAFIEPFGTLWFIYLLPVFFVVTKLTRAAPPLLVFAAAALLQTLHIQSGFILIDEFAARFVYFFAGYWLASTVFRFADRMDVLTIPGLLAALVLWAFVHTQIFLMGVANDPGISLVLGFFGTAAVVCAGVLLSRFRLAEAIRYCGEHSIVIYLAFFLPMAATRSILIKMMSQLGSDVISLVVTAAGLISPVILFWLTRRGPLSFLFTRPNWAKLETSGKVWQSAGHVQHPVKGPLNVRPQTR